MLTSFPVGIPPEMFTAVFPFHIVFDRALRIVQTGDVLRRLSPDLTQEVQLSERLRIIRPEVLLTYDGLCAEQHTVFILELLDCRMHLKGQMVPLESQSLLLFLCSPWFQDPEEITRLGLSMADFAPHDLSIDFLFLLQAQQTALADARALTERLTTQRAELSRTNRQLTTQFAVTRVLAESATLEEATPKFLQALCQDVGWDWGTLWRTDRKSDAMRTAGLWHRLPPTATALVSQTYSTEVEFGVGLIGRAWAGEKPVWISDISKESNFRRRSAALDAGICSAFAFPILSAGKVIGVLEFLSREPRESDSELAAMLTILSTQLAQFIEHKLVDEALRESREKYRLLFDSNPQPMWVYDLETLYFLAVNDTAVQRYGYSRAEFMTMTIRDIRPPEDIKKLEEDIARIHFGSQSSGPWRHSDRNGRIFWVEIGSHNIEYNGREARIVFANDITLRKQAEDELQRVISTTRCLLWHATVHDSGADTMSWDINIANEESAQQFMPLEVAPGERYTDAWHRSRLPADRQRIHETARNAMRSGAAGYRQEFRCYSKDGSLRWLSEETQIEALRPGWWRVVGVCTDITDRKKAEEVLAQAREREIEIGSKIQETLLFRKPPKRIPGMQIAARSLASQRIDGDYYDFFVYDQDRIDVVVGDVMGKGIPAALLAAASKSHFQRAIRRLCLTLEKYGRTPEPEEIVTAVHRVLTGQLAALDSFLTLCYISFDIRQRQIFLVDCGHPRTIHYEQKTGLCSMLQGDNLPLGFSEREIYTQLSLPLEKGDLYFLYSDGVTEARSATGEFFGEERLAEVVSANAQCTPEVLVERVFQAVGSFSGSSVVTDDLTCVAVKIGDIDREYPSLHAAMELRSDLAQLDLVRQFVANFCSHTVTPPLNAISIDALQLAINEAVVNVIEHAYEGRVNQRIQMEASATSQSVTFRMFDWGQPFDPNAVAEPSFDGSRENGFGFYIIKQCVDEVDYSHDELGRNCLTLTKHRLIEEVFRIGD